MRGFDLLDKMGLIAPAYVEAAQEQPGRRSSHWLKWGAAAACLALLGSLGAGLWLQNTAETFPAATPGPTRNPDLPLLTLPESLSGGMGFEGLMAYDISELVNGNPWTEEMNLTTLPVFRNPIAYETPFHMPVGIDQNAMRTMLLDVVGRFGVKESDLTITDNAYDEQHKAAILEQMEQAGIIDVPEEYFAPTRLMAEGGGVSIDVDLNLVATIWFDPALPLPEEYSLSRQTSCEELTRTAQYLISAYADVLGMEQPEIDIDGGDRHFDGQFSGYTLSFFEGSGSDTDRILQYNFRKVSFYGNDSGEPDLIRFRQPDLSGKLGDYPIITADRARELLTEGHYLTTVPCEMPGEKFIRKVELIYRTGTEDAYWMPYYRFWVEVEDVPEAADQDSGLKTYGAYYVPAVAEEYLTDLPLWDGSFN